MSGESLKINLKPNATPCAYLTHRCLNEIACNPPLIRKIIIFLPVQLRLTNQHDKPEYANNSQNTKTAKLRNTYHYGKY